MNIPGYSEEVGALDYELVMYSLIYIYFWFNICVFICVLYWDTLFYDLLRIHSGDVKKIKKWTVVEMTGILEYSKD